MPNLPRGDFAAAYFSMEIALDVRMPTYSGGLGVLAGDMLRSAADLGLPLVAVTLASRAGYFKQTIEDGVQHEAPQRWEPAQFATRVDATVQVAIDNRRIEVGAWLFHVQGGGEHAGDVPVLLLDTDREANTAADRRLTDHLYGGDNQYRLEQEIVLGIAGVRMLRALGCTPGRFHLNEGHSAFLTLELLREQGGVGAPGAKEAVRKRCVFTTHTPVPAGHDIFDYEDAAPALAEVANLKTLKALCGKDRLNTTTLALSLSGWVNAVALKHAETSRSMFPGHAIHAVTNGVHVNTWVAEPLVPVFDSHAPGWRHAPDTLRQVRQVPDEAIWQAHAAAKAQLLEHVAALHPGAVLDDGAFTIGYARRMTAYKRPGLLFNDIARLRAIGQRTRLQILVAGKAHPRDLEGKAAIAHVHQWARELAGDVTLVFLPGYNMDLARLLVSGCDVWLNTPVPPLEASGTSGMKAAVNGVPSLSTLDGWWLEGWQEGVTGWAIGTGSKTTDAADAASLYDKLEHAILPLYTGPRAAWCAVMKNVIAHNAAVFNTHRVMRQYAAEAYGC